MAVGRPGKTWTGVARVEGKFLSPAWSPPAEIRRDKPNMPKVIPGGAPENPMGAAALTLSGGGEYAIHGTNAPNSIGRPASYGCIRMHNQDILDLYQRVNVGTRVVVCSSASPAPERKPVQRQHRERNDRDQRRREPRRRQARAFDQRPGDQRREQRHRAGAGFADADGAAAVRGVGVIGDQRGRGDIGRRTSPARPGTCRASPRRSPRARRRTARRSAWSRRPDTSPIRGRCGPPPSRAGW